MAYPFKNIEPKWQQYWEEHQTFRTENASGKPKAFILDMFPYPSGAGLHVGHPEGYTATDICCRFHAHGGMKSCIRWDGMRSGLPAEHYAMQTNIHPARDDGAEHRHLPPADQDAGSQLRLGARGRYHPPVLLPLDAVDIPADVQFVVRPESPASAADSGTRGRIHGARKLGLVGDAPFTAEVGHMSRKSRHDILADFRLAYVTEVPVNWCEGLGTVLANEEYGGVDGEGVHRRAAADAAVDDAYYHVRGTLPPRRGRPGLAGFDP